MAAVDDIGEGRAGPWGLARHHAEPIGPSAAVNDPIATPTRTLQGPWPLAGRRAARALIALGIGIGWAAEAPGQASSARGLAMGGAGVASSGPAMAAFVNPALTRFRDEDQGLAVVFPFLSATARDESELIEAVDDLQATLDDLQAKIDAADPTALGLRSLAVGKLASLDQRAVDVTADAGVLVLLPTRDYSASLWARVHADARAMPFIDPADLAAIGDPAGTSAALDNLNSDAVLVGARVTEFGATFALEGALGGSLGRNEGPRRVSVGISPKVQWVETYNYSQKVTDFDADEALEEYDRSQFTEDGSDFNVDLGLAIELEPGATLGLSVRDVFRADYGTQSVAGRRFTYQVEPQTTLGVAIERSGFTFTTDLDLVPTRRFKEIGDSHFFRMGFEYDAFGWAQLRAGFAHDIENEQSDIVSLGIGLSPADRVRLDLVGQLGDHSRGAGLQVSISL